MYAFLKAYWERKPQKGLIFYSGRGSQYTSNDFQKVFYHQPIAIIFIILLSEQIKLASSQF